ncbi:zinc finger and BTB domain-containing protein 7C isoform X2 [Lepisosteus oculatus]|nr:PREDICTED: zinc finger and BTB domain-containing protein 7C isoform X2 [Lepisosteus oculatus]XP_015194312.1 PREDICTED: zinc finger and BTB domain-containing protein 7C isoform X2 [Lepisosteus oculatus]XP_015194319.1 PREDICTED: zinc finger and BTB domain-containing protein 7C isoform X2 [Lepisosteus oculatus]XP_015194327.1 PREDICTED: zinc finger and BTB domain-containing protein 7C isoform X2 [Lepisosteus oculatus]XP_015194333.1 PREDICTED: zinc finger and BTB domain-containing protein 7C isof
MMASGDDDLIGIPFPNHSSEVLCSLNEQRRDGLLCDVVLIVRDQEYRTHRSVLAACSQYFKKLFTVGVDGEVHSVYEIDFVAPESLAAILEFAYTSTLTITASNVKDILSAAQMLEIPCIINVCLEIMETGGEEEPEEEDEEEDDGEDEEAKGEEHKEQGDEDIDNTIEVSEIQEKVVNKRIQESPPRTLQQEGLSFLQRQKNSESTELLMEKPRDSESLESRALRDFSIESLLQEGLYPKMSATDQRQSFSPLLPGFFPPIWAADFPGFPQILDHHPTPHPFLQEVDNSPLDLVVKKEAIKEELKEEIPAGLFSGDFLKDLMSTSMGMAADAHLGSIKEERDFNSYLSFLSASHLGSLFPPWQLEEERKMKPKASQQCPICHKVIQGAGKLPRHMRTHTGEKPYMCTICEVRFTRQDKLKIHMRKHTGERPYICLHCNSKFVHNYDLKNHLRIHTGVRPYQCEHCYKSFTRSDHLHRHIKRQSCRTSRPRRGRKPAAWRSSNLLYPPTAHHDDKGLSMGGRLLAPGLSVPGAGFLERRHLGGRNLNVEDLDNNSTESLEAKLSDRNPVGDRERNRGVFAFALARDDGLPHRSFYSNNSDPWGMRLDHIAPIPEARN